MGPWEKYQGTPSAPAGGQPWLKYQQATPDSKQDIPVSQGRTALDQGLQGATFGWADEITDPLGVAIGSFIKHPIDTLKGEVNDPDLADAITNVRQDSKERLKAEFQQHPVTSIASQIAGGALTTGYLASTAPGAVIADTLGSGGTAARIAKGAAAGASSGALYGAGAADEGKRLEGAGEGAIYGGVVGAAIPAASAAIKGTKDVVTGIRARDAEELASQAMGQKSAAGALRGKMADIGAVISPNKAQELQNNLDDALKGLDLIPELSPKTTAIVNRIRDAASGTDGLELNKLDQYRRLLRSAGNEDSVAASAVRKALDNTVNSLTPNDFTQGGTDAVKYLNAFRRDYTQASKFENISDILVKADGDPNRIKAGLTRFLNNKDNLRGFTTNELSALQEAARSSAPEKVLKMFGKFGIDLGSSLTPGNTIGPVVGGYMNPLVPVAGTASRQTQKYLARGKAENLLQLIEQGGKAASQSPALPPILSAPAGELGGAISGVESQTPRTVIPSVNPANKYPVKIDIPAPPPGKQSNNITPATGQPDFLKRLAAVESNNNPNAKAATSSAEGLYQFTNATWRDMVQKYGRQYGITMKDRKDPEKSTIMAKLLTDENKQVLTNRIGREPNETELYAAHFLGAKNAVRLIKNADNNSVVAARMFPEAAQANHNIFYDGRRARRPAEVLALFEDKLKKAKIEA